MSWSKSGSLQDLPFDGSPETAKLYNKNNLCLYCYRWRPEIHSSNQNNQTKATIIILHGAIVHLRLSWLAKRSKCYEDAMIKNRNDIAESLTHNNFSDMEIASLMKKDMQFIDQNTFEFYTNKSNLKFDDSSSCIESSFLNSVIANMEFNKNSPVMDPYKLVSEDEKNKQVFYYGSWVQRMVEMGWCVVGYDLQGHGLSEGYNNKRGNVNVFDDFLDDLDLFIEFVRATCGPNDGKLPDNHLLNISAISLSTLICIRYFSQERSRRHKINTLICFSGVFSRSKIYKRLIHQIFYNLFKFFGNSFKHKSFSILLFHKYVAKSSSEQLYYSNDRYTVYNPLTINTILKIADAINDIEKDIESFLQTNSLNNFYVIHNFYDKINPVDASMIPITKMIKLKQEKNYQMNIKGIVLNYSSKDVKSNENYCVDQWDEEIIKIQSNFNLAHTMITDEENLKIFPLFIKLINNHSDVDQFILHDYSTHFI